MKRLFLLFVLLSTLGLVACSSDEPIDDPNDPGDDPKDEMIELTLEELAYYDGTDGKPAYIAVEGKIYDVTDSSFWRNGGHNGYQAGQDLTDEIINVSPHGVSNLSRVPMIGIIVTGDE